MPRDEDRLVYSSADGYDANARRRGKGARARIEAREEAARLQAADGIVRVGRSTKGRKGKTVSTVSGVPLAGDELRDLAADLKRKCGTGGALKDGVIEIQGDHRDTLVAELEARGFQVKRTGG